MIRNKSNPIVVGSDIPNIQPYLEDVSSVFNPGAIKYEDKYLLMLRVQNRGRHTYFVMAESENGIDFKVEDKIVNFEGLENLGLTLHHMYDPRITKIGDEYYIMFAMDVEDYCSLGLAKTNDFQNFEFMGIVSDNNVRNGVLFPEKINGEFYRLDRPNTAQVEGGPLSGNSIFLSKSKDLINWERTSLIAKGVNHYWDEMVGSGPPPIKTREGWLHIYHGIAMHYGPIYQAGVMLLDLDDPSKVISRGTQNILEPRELYELVGQVPNVVFPCGIIAEEYDDEGFATENSEVKVYYGAADTSVGLATSTVEKLIKQCYE
ncbi:MAG: glycoside hydrolase family 130 protein [Melioribacteraceae bacterium]|nr:glycoside hydrolase family 130 protein [Melioribacteraceae bacterium]